MPRQGKMQAASGVGIDYGVLSNPTEITQSPPYQARSTRINSYLSKIGPAESDVCECGRAPETTEHFLSRCSRWDTKREAMRQVAQSKLGNLSFFLGGKSASDGPKWASNLEAVRAAVISSPLRPTITEKSESSFKSLLSSGRRAQLDPTLTSASFVVGIGLAEAPAAVEKDQDLNSRGPTQASRGPLGNQLFPGNEHKRYCHHKQN